MMSRGYFNQAMQYITGQKAEFGKNEDLFFERLHALNLNNSLVAGFGISDVDTFAAATKSCWGGIIGSAFIRALKSQELEREVRDFVRGIR